MSDNREWGGKQLEEVFYLGRMLQIAGIETLLVALLVWLNLTLGWIVIGGIVIFQIGSLFIRWSLNKASRNEC